MGDGLSKDMLIGYMEFVSLGLILLLSGFLIIIFNPANVVPQYCSSGIIDSNGCVPIEKNITDKVNMGCFGWSEEMKPHLMLNSSEGCPEEVNCSELGFVIKNSAYPSSCRRVFIYKEDVPTCGFKKGEYAKEYSMERESLRTSFDDYYFRECLVK